MRAAGLAVIVLVRHARAGRRGSVRPDAKRPLDDRGRREAERLVALRAPFAVERILSSAAVRNLIAGLGGVPVAG